MKYFKILIFLQIEFWIDLYSFKRKIKIKRDLWKRSLDEQERHLTLGMSSLEQLVTEPFRKSSQKWEVCLTRSYQGIIDEARIHEHNTYKHTIPYEV
jgi:hypothetical protein